MPYSRFHFYSNISREIFTHRTFKARVVSAGSPGATPKGTGPAGDRAASRIHQNNLSPTHRQEHIPVCH